MQENGLCKRIEYHTAKEMLVITACTANNLTEMMSAVAAMRDAMSLPERKKWFGGDTVENIESDQAIFAGYRFLGGSDFMVPLHAFNCSDSHSLLVGLGDAVDKCRGYHHCSRCRLGNHYD